jgi:phosphate transport system substrate-binding protein
MHPDAQINYQSIGSGGGIRQVIEGTVDFGATDGPMTDEQIKQFQDKPHATFSISQPFRRCCPVYNILVSSEELNFTPEALAGIISERSRSGMIRADES